MEWFTQNWEFVSAIVCALLFIGQRMGWIPTKVTTAAKAVIETVHDFKETNPEAARVLTGKITQKAEAAGVEPFLNTLVKKYKPASTDPTAHD